MALYKQLLFCIFIVTSVTSHAESSTFEQELKRLPKGYLSQPNINSALILPTPPVAGSATHDNDVFINKKALQLYGSARWIQAGLDSNLYFPSAAKVYSCAANVDIDPKSTPHIYKLLETSLIDLGLSPYATKNKYQRARPFMQNQQGICEISAENREKYGITYVEDKSKLATDGSYPSGHSAIGWGWALIMSEIAPQRAEHIFLRGRAFAESRLICNVHWQSDVIEGKNIAAMTVAQLHTQKNFLKDLKKAQKEYQRAIAKGHVPNKDACAFEQEALATTIPSVL